MVMAAPEFKQINDDLSRQFADAKKIAGNKIISHLLELNIQLTQ